MCSHTTRPSDAVHRIGAVLSVLTGPVTLYDVLEMGFTLLSKLSCCCPSPLLRMWSSRIPLSIFCSQVSSNAVFSHRNVSNHHFYLFIFLKFATLMCMSTCTWVHICVSVTEWFTGVSSRLFLCNSWGPNTGYQEW